MRFYRIGLLQLLSLANLSLLRSSDAVIFTGFYLFVHIVLFLWTVKTSILAHLNWEAVLIICVVYSVWSTVCMFIFYTSWSRISRPRKMIKVTLDKCLFLFKGELYLSPRECNLAQLLGIQVVFLFFIFGGGLFLFFGFGFFFVVCFCHIKNYTTCF